MTRQEMNIQGSYNLLKEERIVINKDIAFDWIIKIGQDYDGAEDVDELKVVMDELIAYAMLGKECVD